jgi:polynucleotide 5'-hydroxyl-kinase GRC3/NOL9
MDAWRHVLEAILDAPGVVVMLGAVDMGKTTTATAIASAAILAKREAAVVDTDIGQSDIGPPTTVGLAVPTRPANRMDEWCALSAFFVGDTSPRDVSPYLIEGAVRSVERARARRAEVIVTDTTGWVEGPAAVAAKTRKLRRIDPRHVVAIQRRGEVEPILDRLPGSVIVHRLRPSPHVRRRSQELRRAARARRFRRYFARARLHTLALDALLSDRLPVYEGREIPHARVLTVVPGWALNHLLVGLADREGWLRAVGAIVETTPARREMSIMAPIRFLAGVSVLQWGVLRVAPTGVEEGRFG